MMKILNSLKKFFTGRKFRYGSNSFIVTVLFISILIIINLIVDNSVHWKIDLTKNKEYTISKESVDFLKTVDADVKITCFYPVSEEPAEIKNLLNDYKNNNNRISVEFVDPDRNPGIAKKYSEGVSGIDYGTIIVESGSKERRFTDYEMYDTQFQSSRVEQKLASAISYVTDEKEQKAYFISGHGETPIDDMTVFKEILELTNYSIAELNMLTVEEIPADADIIIAVAPKTDLNASEKDKIKKYLNNGGRAALYFDILNDFPNFNDVLREYDINVKNTVAVETDPSRMLSNSNIALIPEVVNTDVTKGVYLKRLPLFAPESRNIEILRENSDGLATVEPLARTSSYAWGETNLKAFQEDNAVGQDANDIIGPLNLAVSVKKNTTNDPEKESRLLVFGSPAYVYDEIFHRYQALGNYDLLVDSLKWLDERNISFPISSKEIEYSNFTVSAAQSGLIMAIILLIPVAVLTTGLVVWHRRKRA